MDSTSPENALAAAGAIEELVHNGLPASGVRTHSEWGGIGRGSAGAFKLLTVASILELPRRSYLLKGLIAPAEMSVWWGPPKCGKSFLVMHIAYALAQNRSVFGRRVKHCRVLYLACEGQAGLKNRVQALVNQYGMSEDFVTIAQPLQLLGTAHTDALVETIRGQFDLVVVDTLNRVIAGGDENSSADMGALIRNLDTIREKTKAHVLVIHHGTKSGRNGPRGHGSLVGAADAIIEVAVGEGEMRTATTTDAKDDASGKVMSFSLKLVELEKDGDGDPVTTCTVVEANDTENKPRRRSILSDSQRGWWWDLADLFAAPGQAQRRVPVEGMDTIPTLTREEVRVGLRGKGRFDCDSHGNLTPKDRDQLRVALNMLKNKGKIGLTDKMVWLL